MNREFLFLIVALTALIFVVLVM